MIRRRLLMALKRGIYRLNNFFAVASYLAHGCRPRNGLIILSYHRIFDGLPRFPPFDPHSVSLETFAAQMALLKKAPRLTPVTSRQVAEWIQRGITPEGSNLLITFDDGYQNVLPAARVLHQQGLQAVFFVATGYLDQPHFRFSSFDQWYLSTPGADPAAYRPLTLAECRHLLGLGMEVQAHSHTHRSLDRLTPSELQEEMRQSKEVLTGRLKHSLLAFSYPYGQSDLGDLSQTAQDEVKAAGHAFACSSDLGTNPPDRLAVEAYRLRRIPIEEEDRGWAFLAKASGYTGVLTGLKSLLHKLVPSYFSLTPTSSTVTPPLPEKATAPPRGCG